MHKTILLFLLTFILCNSVAAQAKLPSAEALDFHKSRRNALRAKLPPNSVAVVFANPTRNRANDVDYVYHQDPNFSTSQDGRNRIPFCWCFQQLRG